MLFIFYLIIAFLLDILIGDPHWFPHPVRGVGWVINRSETLTRKLIANERLAGTVTGLSAIIASVVVVWGSILLVSHWHPVAGGVLTILWLYFGISARDLDKAARQIHQHLKTGQLQMARHSLSMVVGRETDTLDETAISRAAIETVVENTVDGVFSPLFFAMLGGPVLMWAFKAVSTCDSMIGYKNERYRYFGTFSARLDDVANFIPARLVFLLFPLAAWILRFSPLKCLKIAIRDRNNHSSPNAGIPEAATAGALKISLGGPAIYHGVQHNKPYFGGEFPTPKRAHILKSLRLMWVASSLMLITACIISYALS